MLAAVDPGQADAVLGRAADAGVPALRLGVTGGPVLEIEGLAPMGLDALRAAWEGTLPALFGLAMPGVGRDGG